MEGLSGAASDVRRSEGLLPGPNHGDCGGFPSGPEGHSPQGNSAGKNWLGLKELHPTGSEARSSDLLAHHM